MEALWDLQHSYQRFHLVSDINSQLKKKIHRGDMQVESGEGKVME